MSSGRLIWLARCTKSTLRKRLPATEFEGDNMAHRPGVKGGPSQYLDRLCYGFATAMCETLGAMGLEVEVHHHEVATACQNEIGVKFNTLVKKAMKYKYQIRCSNVANAYGKTHIYAKTLVGDNGSECTATSKF